MSEARSGDQIRVLVIGVNNAPTSSRGNTFSWILACADPEIFMRGGPTKMVIFGHRRGGGGSNPQKIPKLPFFLKFQGGGGPDPRSPPLDPRMVGIM